MKKPGFAFHCYHYTLFSWVYDYDKRVSYIKADKPKAEQKLRLKLFRMIPEDRLPSKLHEAREAYNEAWEAYNKAGEAFNMAGEACMPELLKLHEELCPNCPFDGKTIFPEVESETADTMP